MNRRDFLATGIAAICLGTAAEAKDFAEDILRQLRRNGYKVVSISRTLLGRTRIRATRAGGEREIILNAATGEILRDVWIIGEKGSGGLWDDDDRDDDDDDDDRDDDDDDDNDGDDNSGKGGGGGGDDDDD